MLDVFFLCTTFSIGENASCVVILFPFFNLTIKLCCVFIPFHHSNAKRILGGGS
jgi:hypothetical protein